MQQQQRDDQVPVVRFTRQEDEAVVRRLLYPRPNVRLAENRVPECHNVVGLANYEISFDQFKLLREFPNIEFQQKDFPAAIWRGRPPRGTTLLVFKSGRTVQMGMHSDVQFNHAVQRFRMELVQRSYMPMLKPLRYENRVYSHQVGYPVRIWEIEFQDELGCAYIPSLFPGLVYRMFRPPVTALVFVSGKLMLLGVRHTEHLEPALDHLEPILRQHQHHGHNPGEQRKSVARQADRVLQAQARIDQMTFTSDDPKVQKKERKEYQARMKKAVKIASKSQTIFSLKDLQSAIDSEFQKLHEKEQKRREKEEKKRAEAEREAEELRQRQERRQARHSRQSQEDDDADTPNKKRPRVENQQNTAAPPLEDMPELGGDDMLTKLMN